MLRLYLHIKLKLDINLLQYVVSRKKLTYFTAHGCRSVEDPTAEVVCQFGRRASLLPPIRILYFCAVVLA